jgi:hypothetical protein
MKEEQIADESRSLLWLSLVLLAIIVDRQYNTNAKNHHFDPGKIMHRHLKNFQLNWSILYWRTTVKGVNVLFQIKDWRLEYCTISPLESAITGVGPVQLY